MLYECTTILRPLRDTAYWPNAPHAISTQGSDKAGSMGRALVGVRTPGMVSPSPPA